MFLVCVLFVVILIALFVENFLHQRNLKKIPIRILVNGTRGKTSVCRILHKALNNHGIPTLGRTTGSEAVVLNPDGSCENIIRKKDARILEMIPFVRLAAHKGVKCIVVECMAIQPENQKVMARYLIRPTHVLITNSYVDHVAEMGWKRNDVIWCLAQSVPRDASVFSTDIEYEGLGREFRHVTVKNYDIKDSSIPVHDENISIVVSFLSSFGIDEDEVVSCLPDVAPDKGLSKPFCNSNGALFIPDFAVNDLTCMENSLKAGLATGRELYIVYNNRKDREYRILLLVKAVGGYAARIKGVYCIGDFPKKVAGYIRSKTGICSIPSSVEDVSGIFRSGGDGLAFLALGNIKGEGERLLEKLKEGEN